MKKDILKACCSSHIYEKSKDIYVMFKELPISKEFPFVCKNEFILGNSKFNISDSFNLNLINNKIYNYKFDIVEEVDNECYYPIGLDSLSYTDKNNIEYIISTEIIYNKNKKIYSPIIRIYIEGIEKYDYVNFKNVIDILNNFYDIVRDLEKTNIYKEQ